MIPNQWYVILQSKDVSKNKPTKTRRMGENLVLWRDVDGNLVCQEARCPHKGANLGDGRLKGSTVECPYHGFRFNTEGACVAMPCMGSDARIPQAMRIRTYPVREHLGLVWLWWGEDRAVLPEIEVPAEVAHNPLTHATMSWSRPVNYTRYIESTLEFYHITFVHRDHWFNTVDYVFLHGTPRRLGLDGRRRYLATTKIENNHLEVDGQTLRYTYDHLDEDDPSNSNGYEVTFAFPAMTHVVTKQFEVTAWFAPIDENNTEFILRWYEFPRLKSALRAKPLRRLVPAIGLFMEKWIQDMQDVRIIQGQSPQTSRRGASKFIAVDELNAKYVSMRTQLLREAGVDPDGDTWQQPPAQAKAVKETKRAKDASDAAAAAEVAEAADGTKVPEAAEVAGTAGGNGKPADTPGTPATPGASGTPGSTKVTAHA